MESLAGIGAHCGGLSPEQAFAIIQREPSLARWLESFALFYRKFTPRPDRPELFDQQAGYVTARDQVSFLVAGNSSGKTTASAAKCAKFLLQHQAPPRRDTPFWILSETMDLCCDVCWSEKLVGEGHIPPAEIEWERISWHNAKDGQPSKVPLRPWPRERGGKPGKNWRLEFKSYEQGRKALQGKSIGGFWFSEQFPVSLFTEVLVRCRKYLFPGGQFAEFTPLEPDLCVWLEEIMDEPPPKWCFYRGNMECNRPNLAEGAIEAMLATVPPEMMETRTRGALASFQGAIYTSFNPAIHVRPNTDMEEFPEGCIFGMGTDWGASTEHPQVTVFGCMDGAGYWKIFDEYWSVDQKCTIFEHAQNVVARARLWGWTVAQRWCAPLQRLIDVIEPNEIFGMNYADPSRPGSINEFSTYGVPTGGAVNDVYEGINFVRYLLHVDIDQPRLVFAKRCKHCIDEHRRYRWMRGRKPTEGIYLNPKAPKPIPLKRDDDTCDGTRYLTFTTHRMGRTDPVLSAKRAPPTGLLTRTTGQFVPGMFRPRLTR
jgi:phage terminase large subunit-like protein